MRINPRQEIAMWVLGLLWTGLAFVALSQPAAMSELGSTVAIMLVLMVLIFLVLYGLRDRNKPK